MSPLLTPCSEGFFPPRTGLSPASPAPRKHAHGGPGACARTPV